MTIHFFTIISFLQVFQEALGDKYVLVEGENFKCLKGELLTTYVKKNIYQGSDSSKNNLLRREIVS